MKKIIISILMICFLSSLVFSQARRNFYFFSGFSDTSKTQAKVISIAGKKGTVVLTGSDITQDSSHLFVAQSEKNTWNSSVSSSGILTGNKTVNLTSTMTAVNIQDSINAQPSNLGGHILTFQFADGTYSLTAPLLFSGFFSGTLRIYGNSTEAVTKHTTQAVILSMASGQHSVFNIVNTTALIYIYWIKFSVDCSATYINTIQLVNTCYGFISFCYFLGNSTTYGNGVALDAGSAAKVYECYFSNLQVAISSVSNSQLQSYSNSSTGTNPGVGLYSHTGAVIAKFNATQPAAGTAEDYGEGGVIR